MHAAADRGHSSVVEVLIRSHADINAIDKVSEYIHLMYISVEVTKSYILQTFTTRQ